MSHAEYFAQTRIYSAAACPIMHPPTNPCGVFSFVSDSHAQYNLAVISLRGFKCDENEGCAYSVLVDRAVRLLREAASDHNEAQQLLSACCRAGLVKNVKIGEKRSMPTAEMVEWARHAHKHLRRS